VKGNHFVGHHYGFVLTLVVSYGRSKDSPLFMKNLASLFLLPSFVLALMLGPVQAQTANAIRLSCDREISHATPQQFRRHLRSSEAVGPM
jgi:hypothetical protein